MKLRALFIGVLAASLCTSAAVEEITTTAHEVPTVSLEQLEADRYETYVTARLKYRSWNMLCLRYAHDTGRVCGRIKAPKVKRESMRKGLRGYYDGGDTVYVNRTLRGWDLEATLVHEMSHYLDTMVGLNPPMPVKKTDLLGIWKLCMSEKRAWDLTDEYWRDQGKREEAVDGSWVRWYDHCRQFANKLYPDIYQAPLPDERWLFRRYRGLI